MQHFTYKTSNVCSQVIEFDLSEDLKVYNVKFFGGCNGNLKAIGKLVEGMEASKVISILKGNTCGYRQTSCADQLTKALENALN